MSSVENDPEHPTQDHYARLGRHRAAGWDIDDRRDGFRVYSALKRDSSSIVYLVAHSVPELVALIDRFEEGTR